MTELHRLEHLVLRFLAALPMDDDDADTRTIAVIAMVSGGHDSMCLLNALARIVQSSLVPAWLRIHLEALHCNHEKRGVESDADEEFVRHECVLRNVPLTVARLSELPAEQLAHFQKGNFQNQARLWRETTAQRLRLDLLERTRAGSAWIATAHHARDNAESILLHLIRGTGPAGLRGISQVSPEQHFIRPLVRTDFAELVEYGRKLQVSFRDDASNLSLEYSRNFVRHMLLPNVEKLNPSYESGFRRTADAISDLLEKLEAPKGILPLTTDLSTGDIIRFAAQQGQELRTAITAGVAQNILTHARKYQRELVVHPWRTMRIPLRDGWVALASRHGLRFEKLT